MSLVDVPSMMAPLPKVSSAWMMVNFKWWVKAWPPQGRPRHVLGQMNFDNALQLYMRADELAVGAINRPLQLYPHYFVNAHNREPTAPSSVEPPALFEEVAQDVGCDALCGRVGCIRRVGEQRPVIQAP